MKTRSLKRIVAAISVASLIAGCGSESADDLLASAKGYLAKKDNKAAVVQLKNVLQKNSDSPEARFLLGQTLLESGDAVSAAVELRKALDLKYPQPRVIPALAKALLGTREYKKLTDEFGNLTLPEPQPAADLKTSVAIAYVSQANVDKARTALKAAFEAVPDYAPALVVAARLEASEKHFDKALVLIEKALSINPADAQALHFKGGFVYYTKSDLPAAIEFYRKAVQADPLYLPARIDLVDSLLAQRDIAGATAQVNELRKAFPNHLQSVYFDAHLAYLNQDNKKAAELIQNVLKSAPNHAKALELAGAIEWKNQSLPRAEDYLSRALQLAPGLSGARRLLTQSYLQSGQPEKALATLEPLLSRDDPDADTLSLAAQAQAQSGDMKQAQANLLRAAKLRPADTRSRVALAFSHVEGGNIDAALAEVEAIAATDSGPYADAVLVNAYLRKGELDKALKAVETMEKKQPNKPYAAHLRGRVQLLRNDIADARRSFERALAVDRAFVPAAASLAVLDLADKKPDMAKKRFDSVLAADPKNTQALLAIAGLHARAGGSAEEVAVLVSNAIKANPNDVRPRATLVDHYLAHKDPKRALAAAQEAVAALPQSAELLDSLGRAQAAAGERNQAVASFIKLAGLQPRSPQPFMRLAGIYIDANDTNEARRSLVRALEIKPDLLLAQRTLIELELKSQRPDEALAVARTVRKQRPSEDIGFALEGAIEASRKNSSAAIEIYRAGLKQTASSDLAVKLHAALSAAEKTSEAEKFSTSWLKEHPKDARFLSHLGEVSLAQRNYQAAENYYRMADQLAPNNVLVMNNLAWVMAQLNKPGAVAYAQKANALFPDQPVLMDTLAAALVSEKQFAKAIEVEKKALALAPDAHDMRLSLAKMYIQTGDKASARAELDKLAKPEVKFPGQSEVSRLLATL